MCLTCIQFILPFFNSAQFKNSISPQCLVVPHSLYPKTFLVIVSVLKVITIVFVLMHQILHYSKIAFFPCVPCLRHCRHCITNLISVYLMRRVKWCSVDSCWIISLRWIQDETLFMCLRCCTKICPKLIQKCAMVCH